MNKTVVGGSAVLLVLGLASFLLPAPASWLSPVLTLGAWAWAALGPRSSKKAAPVEAPAAAVGAAPEVREVVRVQEVLPGAVAESIQRQRTAADLAGGLKSLVVTDTEAAVLRLTEALFTLVGNSKEVSSHIEQSLAFITDGDTGLGRTVANLEEQVRVFEALATHFTQLKDGLTGDIGALTKTVGSINQFSETLSDLADQTNVLAINASIEAARVGIHGRGFAVIATQVQALARNSKDISEKMARTVQDVVSNVETSFGRQIQRIREADTLIVHSEQELRRWADHVGPQLAEVGAMIGDSRRLAEVVTGELNDVTVSLQFQDRTRQILDHLQEILDEATSAVVRAAGLADTEVNPGLRDRVLEDASRRFTVREEWALVSPGTRTTPHHGPRAVELF